MEKKPFNFLICFNDKCAFANKCLRQLSAQASLDSDNILQIVNHTKFNETNCKHYLENKKVSVAYGMINSFKEVKAKDIVQIRKSLINHFGNNYYYKKRRGELPITPKDQEFISNLFNSYGYEIKFDEIREEVLWK
jgi:hypothetical protein